MTGTEVRPEEPLVRALPGWPNTVRQPGDGEAALPRDADPPATPAEATPAEATPADTIPAETTPVDTTPADTTPAADAAPQGTPAGGRPGRTRRGTGARELRRQQTREAIMDAAAQLFAERGFDAVSVLEIARRAGVVEKTVFNHFPVKEGLVFEADPPMRAALIDAVGRRPAGMSAALAAGSFVVAAVSQLGSPAAIDAVAEMARVVRGSRTLVVREREILGTLTDALAGQMAQESGAPDRDLEPWLAAHAVLGLYAALLDLARDRALAPDGSPGGPGSVTVELRAAGERGLALLGRGLAGHAIRG